MAQKINPQALRLEKTNKHHKACWYGDYYYTNRLLNNYKSCKYIDNIFRKIKRCLPDHFLKVHHQCNQFFCFFPRRGRRFWSPQRSPGLARPPAQPYPRGPAFSEESAKSAPGGNLPFESLFYTFLMRQKESRPLLVSRKRLGREGNLGRFPASLKALCNPGGGGPRLLQPRLGEWGGLGEIPSRRDRELPRALIWRALGVLGEKKLRVAQEKLMTDRQIRITRGWRKIAHKERISQVLDCPEFPSTAACLRKLKRGVKRHRLDKHFTLDALDSPRGKTFLGHPSGGLQRSLKNFYLKKGAERAAPPGGTSIQEGLLARDKSIKTYFYPIKVRFPQQSCEFLAQKVCRALYHRTAFGRLKRQILWDVRSSLFLKGVRVSCAGRVESKSKKAQKARSRTFQWGQTESGVFSSPVQFISKAIGTPFGKIGVKVWLCFTKDLLEERG